MQNIQTITDMVAELGRLNAHIETAAATRDAKLAEYTSLVGKAADPAALDQLEDLSLRVSTVERTLSIQEAAISAARKRCRVLMVEIAGEIGPIAGELEQILQEGFRLVVARAEVAIAKFFPPEVVKGIALRTTAVLAEAEHVQASAFSCNFGWVWGPNGTHVMGATVQPAAVIHAFKVISERLPKAKAHLAELKAARS